MERSWRGRSACAVSRTAAADGDGTPPAFTAARPRICAGDGLQAIREAVSRSRCRCATGMTKKASPAPRPIASSPRSRRSRYTGFPESHAQLRAARDASAYISLHYRRRSISAAQQQTRASTSPSTLVKDAQRAGVRFTDRRPRSRTGTAGRADGAIRSRPALRPGSAPNRPAARFL